MKTWYKVSSLVILCCLALGGCGKKSTDSETAYASVRFIHSSPSSGLMDFSYLAEGATYYTDIVSEASYGTQHGYFSLVSGSRSFQAFLTGTSLTIANITVSLTGNGKYSIIADDLDAAINPSLLAIADTTGVPASGKAFLRFVHVSADAPDLDIIKADSSILIADLKRYQASDYVELDAGTYELAAVSSDSGKVMLDLPPITLTSGINYSVLLSGSAYGLPGSELNAKTYQEMGGQ
jgi:hypothetical protein